MAAILEQTGQEEDSAGIPANHQEDLVTGQREDSIEMTADQAGWRCTRLYATAAAKNVKCRSGRQAASRYTVVTASGNRMVLQDQEDHQIILQESLR